MALKKDATLTIEPICCFSIFPRCTLRLLLQWIPDHLFVTSNKAKTEWGNIIVSFVRVTLHFSWSFCWSSAPLYLTSLFISTMNMWLNCLGKRPAIITQGKRKWLLAFDSSWLLALALRQMWLLILQFSINKRKCNLPTWMRLSADRWFYKEGMQS